MRLALLLILTLVACDDRKPGAAVRVDAAPSAAAAGAVGAVGVDSCDAYLQKMSRCMERLAPDAQETMRRAMDETRRSWRQAAGTPEGKATLTTACQQALDAGKTAAQAMGCEW